ncbi:MAG: 3-hexulose-6-phosphate synthase [Saccharofermentanales bacterium]
MTKLQIALDHFSADEAVALVDKIYDIIDIVEIGTPIILRDGLHPVKRIKERHPELCVLADTKIVDGGCQECEDACKAGADIITVLALSDDYTIKGVVETAHRWGRQAFADLIQVRDIAIRAKQLVQLCVDYVCVHTAVDVQTWGKTPLDELRILSAAIPAERTAVAGGINEATLDSYLAEQPAILIMGSALTKAPDVREAIVKTRWHISQYNKHGDAAK